MAAVFGAVFALRWWRDDEQRWWLASYMAAFAIGMAAIFLATRGLSDLAQHCDAISPRIWRFSRLRQRAHVRWRWSPSVPRYCGRGSGDKRYRRIACLRNSIPRMPAVALCCARPAGARLLVHLHNGRASGLGTAYAGGCPLFQLFVAWLLARMCDGSRESGIWFDYPIVLAGAILADAVRMEIEPFASVIALIPLGWLLSRLRLRLTRPNMRQKLLASVLFAAILLPSLPATLSAPFMNAFQKHTRRSSHVRPIRDAVLPITPSCSGRLPSGTIFAPLDIGPDILLARPQRRRDGPSSCRHQCGTLSLPIWHNAEAHEIGAFTSRYVVLCSDLDETGLFKSETQHHLL